MEKYTTSRGVLSCTILLIIIDCGDFNKAVGCLEDERTALLNLQKHGAGDYNDTKWDIGEDCCNWGGVSCDEISKRVISLHLQQESIRSSDIYSVLDASLLQPFEELQSFYFICGEGLKGRLRFPKLQVLHLSFCNLTSLPPNGIQLPSSKSLHLSYCTGGYDDLKELTNSSSLELVNLYNSLGYEGRIPPSILALTSIKMLGLSCIQLNGSLPEGLCAFTNLEELDLSENEFEGVIPTCLSNLTSLRFLDLSGNQFSGNIPSNLFSSLKSLEYLSLSYNHFDGFFSFSSFANNSKLEWFELESYNSKLKVETENAQWLPSFFQLKTLLLSNCILNEPTRVIPSFLLSQYDLRTVCLENNGMTGEFPSWLLTNNSKLGYLSLKNNTFSGQFMMQLHPYHAYMFWLDLSMNRLVGEIPSFIGSNLPNLIYLNVSGNTFEGSIPSSIENMRNLRLLDLSNNHFSGEFTGNFFNGLKYLQSLKVSNNNLGGNLTKFLSNLLQLPDLRALYLDNNNFYGDLQLETVQLPDYMTALDVSNNSITGRFPDWIAELRGLEILVLSYNHLQGKLPTNLCKINMIRILDLSGNNFSDTFPSCSNMIRILDLYGNNFSDTFWQLSILHLQGNGFYGPLPTSLSLSSLVTFDVSDNKFSGLIPPFWNDSISSLKFLILKGNNLSGPIPSEICQIEDLRYLDISSNNLSGSIPSCFSNMSVGKTKVLDFLDDNNNEVYGIGDENSIPGYSYERQLQVRTRFQQNLAKYRPSNVEEKVQFTTKNLPGSYSGYLLYSMVGIDLSLNRLTGPMLFGNWDNVKSLNLSYNLFNGSIPMVLSNLINLESLDLSHNMLSDKIPSEMSKLTYLEVFSVAYNNLSGSTPIRSNQFGTFEARSYVGNPFLCGPPLDRSCGVGPTKMPQAKLFAEPEQNDSSYNTTFLWSFFGSFVVSCIGAFVFISFCTNVPQIVLQWIGVEDRIHQRTTVELPWRLINR